MSLKHAILGFLSFDAFSGYDLKKHFDRSVQHFWPANQSQIYRTLAQMKKQGWVTMERIEREDRLDKKLYTITAKGREELHDWLSTPLPPQDYREPFLIQLYFAGKITDEELINVLKHEIRALEEKICAFNIAYEAYQERMPTHPQPRAYFLSVLTLEYGLVSAKASLAWMRRVLERVESGEFVFEDINIDMIECDKE